MEKSVAGNQHLNIAEEARMIAYIARGDTIPQIQAAMLKDFGRTVAAPTVSNVKKRNKENLELIRSRLIEKNENDARALKEKSNKMISKKLDSEDKKLDVTAKAQEDYLAGHISIKEYVEIMKRNREVSLTELVSVSKEMHNQSAEDPAEKTDSQKDMSTLLEAIASGDEVKLNQIIFNSKDKTDG